MNENRKVILFIAMSLDGFIADKYGKVDWLNSFDNNESDYDAYSEFIKNIDTVIMGYKTYNQVITELSPEKWVYDDLKSYVLTHKNIKSSDKITFTDQNPCKLVNDLKKQNGKDIWICGGANLINQLISNNLIEEYRISVIPVLIGEGIKLFNNNKLNLTLKQAKTYNQITELIYQKNKAEE